MNANTPANIRVTSPAGLAAYVPTLLGFHPTESLVVVGLANNRVECSARLDLSDEVAEVLADQLTPMLVTAGVEQVVWFAYTDNTDLLPAFAVAVSEVTIPSLGFLWVDGDVVRDAMFPAELVGATTTAVIDGVPAPAASRAVLAEQFMFNPALELTLFPAPDTDEEAVLERAEALFASADPITEADAAWLVSNLSAIPTRDAIMVAAAHTKDSSRVARKMLGDTACRVTGENAVPVLAVFALMCALEGDGATGVMAAEHAQTLPGGDTYSLLMLVNQMLFSGLHPQTFRDIYSGLYREMKADFALRAARTALQAEPVGVSLSPEKVMPW